MLISDKTDFKEKKALLEINISLDNDKRTVH